MAETHFEQQARRVMQEIATALLTVKTTDPNVVRLQARYEALNESITIARRAAREDAEGDLD